MNPAPESANAPDLSTTNARVDELQQQVRDLIAKDVRRPDAEPTVLPDPKRGPASMFVLRCTACGFAVDSNAASAMAAIADGEQRHDCGARQLTATPVDYSRHPSFQRWA